MKRLQFWVSYRSEEEASALSTPKEDAVRRSIAVLAKGTYGDLRRRHPTSIFSDGLLVLQSWRVRLRCLS
jgi:hypothetical protein